MNINENIKNQQKYDKTYYHVPLNRPKEHKKWKLYQNIIPIHSTTA